MYFCSISRFRLSSLPGPSSSPRSLGSSLFLPKTFGSRAAHPPSVFRSLVSAYSVGGKAGRSSGSPSPFYKLSNAFKYLCLYFIQRLLVVCQKGISEYLLCHSDENISLGFVVIRIFSSNFQNTIEGNTHSAKTRKLSKMWSLILLHLKV